MQGYYFARPSPVAECTQALFEDRALQQPDTRPTGVPLLLVCSNEDHRARLENVARLGRRGAKVPRDLEANEPR